MEQITLDLIPSGTLPVLHASQYDDGRQWKVNLTENGEDYTLSNETIVLDVRKGDGCAVTCAVAIESGKKYVILTSTEQMCAVAGSNLAELQITKGDMKIGTLNFILQVERDPLDGSISSGSEIHDLQHQVDECVENALADLGASGLPYDNTESGLEATNVQQAIDEVNEKASDLASELDDKADKANTYTKSEVNDIADTKADANNVYAKSETYTKTEVDAKVVGLIDDTSTANNKAWSSNKISAELADLLPVDEVSGAVANFDTDVVLPLIDVKSEIKALETGTGTKSPSNPYVISGFTGAKIGYVDFNQLVQNGNFENSDGWFPQNIIVDVSNNVLTINVATAINSGIRMPVSAIKGHKYYKKVEVKSNIVMRSDIDGVGTVSSNGSNSWETLENIVDWSNYNTDTWNFYIRRKAAGETSSTAEIRNCVLIDITQLFGSTIADYLYSLSDNGLSILKQLFTKDYYAYNVGGSLVTVDSVNNEQTCPNASVSWQTEAGEVFGGEVDATNGKLKITHERKKIKDFRWTYQSANTRFFTDTIASIVKRPPTNNDLANGLNCECYSPSAFTGLSNQKLAIPSTSGNIFLIDTDYTDAVSLVNAVGENYIIYPLATPIEIDISDTASITAILGVNNIFNDTNGNTTVKYKLGIQKYIDKKIAEVQALVL